MKYFSVLVLIHFAISVKLPSTIPKCDYKSSNFNECLKASTQQFFLHGDRPYDELGIPQLEPLSLPAVTIPSGKGVVDVEENFINVKFHGLGQLNVENATMQLEGRRKRYYFFNTLKKFSVEGQYNLNGRMLLVPIKGEGDFEFNFSDSMTKFEVHFAKISQDGVAYLKVNSVKLTIISLGHMAMHFDNLFGGDKTLGDTMNQLLNENWQQVFEDLKAPLQQTIGDINKEILNRFFSRVSLSEVLDNAP